MTSLRGTTVDEVALGRSLVVSVAVAALFVAACCPEDEPEHPRSTSRRSPREAACADTPIKGSRSQMTIVPGAATGPAIDAPEECPGPAWQGGFYVRVHGHGERRLAYDRRPGPCDTPDADRAACPTISVHAFSASVFAAMKRRVGDANADGLGLGVCGDVKATLDRWNVSSRVHDWRFVDEALRAIDDELRRWNVAGDYGLSISGIPCVQLVSEERGR